jgi:anti-sigma regulatory factor (Ser/Thr protein kinase)
MLDLGSLGTADSLRQAVATLEKLCLESGYSAQRVHEITIAVHEALTNALRHGNGGAEEKPIRLRARVEGAALKVEVEDQGRGLQVVPPPPDLTLKLSGEDRPAGWGVFLMRSLSSEVVFVRHASGGAVVRMRFEATAPTEPVEIRLIASEGSSTSPQGAA